MTTLTLNLSFVCFRALVAWAKRQYLGSVLALSSSFLLHMDLFALTPCVPLVFLLLFVIHCIYNTHISTHMHTLKECSPFVMAQSCQVVTVLAIILVLASTVASQQQDWIQPGACLWELWLVFLVHGFLPQSKHLHGVWSTGDPEQAENVNVCLSPC